jgi:hypothetical protein
MRPRARNTTIKGIFEKKNSPCFFEEKKNKNNFL